MTKKKNTKKLNKIKDVVNSNSERRYQKEKNKKNLDNLTFEERLRYKNSPSKYKNTQYDLSSTSSADSYLAYTKKLSKLNNEKVPTFVGPIPTSWKRNAISSRFKAEPIQTNEILSLKNLCIKKISTSLENNDVIKNFNDLPVHLKEAVMNKIPIYNCQMTNEMLVNFFLESDFSHLNLVHSLITFPVLSAILKIRYISKHHKLPSTSVSSVSSSGTTSPILNNYKNNNTEEHFREIGRRDENEETEISPPDSWEDIYNSSEENDIPQIYVNKRKNKEPMKENEEYYDDEDEEDSEELENENLKEEIKILEKKFKKHISLTSTAPQRAIENFKGFKNLVSLDISYCNFLSPKIIPLIQILGDYVPHLKYLNLSGTLIESNGHSVLFMISRLLPYLNFLILNDIKWLENEDLMSLSWNHYFKHLIQLQLKQCHSINPKTLTNFFNLHRPTILLEF